jgi:isoamylase
MRTWPGSPQPLGATWDGEGVNFALFSEHAEAVELCLFDATGAPSERIGLTRREGHAWHVYLPDVRPGQLYGYRVHGPYDPEQGHRFNPNLLLLDPYARAICGPLVLDDRHFAYIPGHPDGDLSFNTRDNADAMPKCVVCETAFSWADDAPPRTPMNRTVIYECHVKGMTATHPAIPEHLRGTYLGLATDPVLDHLLSLGVTAVELLPIHHRMSERGLVERGLENYWGYGSIGYFAPDSRFATSNRGEQVQEFRSMVKALHRVGIEVILDVVYNHSAEGNELGPTLCFRGIDNATYYRLDTGTPRRYADYTGCGNSLNAMHPRVLQMVLDSLRYWVSEMHVDGFRFDLAPTLGRDPHSIDGFERFFTTVSQDPVLGGVKLIAEPWDLGPDGYQVGRFPAGWAEWNGRYRDTVRRFWRGDAGCVPELASRLAGSSDLFSNHDRKPHSSINFVTCHDGFTLRDLVSYEHKHNEANGEDNRDGSDNNLSRNWGAEGETPSLAIARQRARMQRNFLATLAFSQGVPMLAHGDEVGRTQHGNNNAYCQDNETTWIDWSPDEGGRRMLSFAREVLRLRAEHPTFRRREFFDGGSLGNGHKDVSWIRTDGTEMETADWQDANNRVLGMLIHGDAADDVDERGRPYRDLSLLLLLNGGHRSRRFALPGMRESGVWRERINTARPGATAVRSDAVNLAAHSLILLAHEVRP